MHDDNKMKYLFKDDMQRMMDETREKVDFNVFRSDYADEQLSKTEKIMYSTLMVRGKKDNIIFYIADNQHARYNVYQTFSDDNDVDLSVIPKKEDVGDNKIIVYVPHEEKRAFLFLYDLDIYEMNRFRITLESEEILRSDDL